MLIPAIVFLMLIVALGFGVHVAMKYAAETKRRLLVAKRAYQLALEEVKKNPTSPDARQTALQLGRRYSALTREHNNVTLFDEIALKNDIDAASAGVAAIHTSGQSKRK